MSPYRGSVTKGAAEKNPPGQLCILCASQSVGDRFLYYPQHMVSIIPDATFPHISFANRSTNHADLLMPWLICVGTGARPWAAPFLHKRLWPEQSSSKPDKWALSYSMVQYQVIWQVLGNLGYEERSPCSRDMTGYYDIVSAPILNHIFSRKIRFVIFSGTIWFSSTGKQSSISK